MLVRHHHRLANGLRLVFTECPHLHAASVSVVIGCGARHDGDATPGLTHFVEHMLFRGSQHYPSPAALVAPFEAAGGTLNGETWRDHTHFSTTVHPKGLGPVVHALGDMLRHPTWQDLPAERNLVEAELLADLDGEDDASGDADLHNLSRAAIWRDHPMGRRITGTLAALRRFRVADVAGHHRRHYHAGNVVVSIAGPLRFATWLPQLRRAFGPIAAAPNDAAAPVQAAPRFAPTRRLLSRDVATNQVSLQLSYRALADTHPDFVALQLLSAVLDDGMGTRLHRSLSEASGLVYAFHSGLDCYRDAGIYELEMQLAPGRTAAALRRALRCFAEVAQGGVSAQELARAKARAEMASAMGADAVDELSYDAALDVLFARPTPQQLSAQRQAVTLADVRRVAQAVFVASPRHVTLMGPLAQVDRLAVGQLLRAPPRAQEAARAAHPAHVRRPQGVATSRAKRAARSK